MSDVPGTHGSVGLREGTFVRLFDKRLVEFKEEKLRALAEQMIGNKSDDATNVPDGEENLAIPAGYTYFGQFVDHDLTFDTTSSLTDSSKSPTNLRTPRLDLDCLYGAGPDDQPYLYATEDAAGLFRGASLLLGNALEGSPNRRDLLRVGDGDRARAVIGDPRNDENSIVCNIQAAMIKFHNTVVERLAAQPNNLRGTSLFIAARKLVRWTYQRVIVDDFLPRVIEPATYNTFRTRLENQGEGAFQMYKPALRVGMPIEFTGAGYRFGHSMVRTGYKLNDAHEPQKIFTPDRGLQSLMGFGKLDSRHWIEWKRFFPDGNTFSAKGNRPRHNDNKEADRLQWAYRIDTSLVNPLANLPDAISKGDSLADLNLRRGNVFRLVSGQTVAERLGQAPLDQKYLVVRDSDSAPFGYIGIDEDLHTETPLWYYVLAEAQRELVDLWLAKNDGATEPKKLEDADLLFGLPDADGKRTNSRAPISQLGPVGGMILLETFFGLLLADDESFMAITRDAADADKQMYDQWFEFFTDGGKLDVSMWRLLEVAGLT